MRTARPLPAYVRDIVRRKDEALLASLAFLAALRRGEADEPGRLKTIARIMDKLSPEARSLAEHHPETYG